MLREKARRIGHRNAVGMCAGITRALRKTQACEIGTPDQRSFTGVRRIRLEGPKKRRIAQPINWPRLPVKCVVVEISHGASFRKTLLKECHSFYKFATAIKRQEHWHLQSNLTPCAPEIEWRRARDSNPRYPFRYVGFQDRCHQPLGQLSADVRLSQIVRPKARPCEDRP